MRMLLKIAAVVGVSLLIGSMLEAGTYPKRPVLMLTEKNTAAFRGPVDPSSVSTTLLKVWKLENNSFGTPIYLIMDSPGGYIDAGLDFVEGTKNIRNLHTVTLFAASMASAIVQQLPGNRYITAAGQHMYHRARGGFQGQFETGEVETRLTNASYMIRTLLEMPNARRMGLALQEYKDKARDEYWLTGEQAIAAKSADAVIELRCNKVLTEGQESIAVQTLFGPVELIFSKCPLIRNPIFAKFGGKDKVRNEAVMEAVKRLQSGTKDMDYVYRKER